MRRWSSLQRQLYSLIDPAIDFQVHCRVYRMASQRGSTGLPRYWITLGKKIIWDYPKDFVDAPDYSAREPVVHYPYVTDVSSISDRIREYIDTPPHRLMSDHVGIDPWGLTDILRAADRRIGVRRFAQLRQRVTHEAALEVMRARDEADAGADEKDPVRRRRQPSR